MSTPTSPTANQPEHATEPRSTSQLRFGWIMPPYFHELPIDAPDADTAAERLRTIATNVLPEHSLDDQYAFALLLGSQLEPMTEGNVLYAGLSFLEVAGQPTSSTVLVSQFAHDKSEDDVVPSLVDTLSRTYPRDDVQQTDLPCGPAVSRIGSSPFAFDDPMTGVRQRIQRSIIQTYIPLPHVDEVLLFELGVYSAEGWELHSEVFAEVLKTIDWCTDKEIVETARLSQNRPPNADETINDSVRTELTALCAELIDAVTGIEPAPHVETRLSAVPCSDCWERGLRSSCRVVHEWRGSGLPQQTLQTVATRISPQLRSLGWQVTNREPTASTWNADTARHSLSITTEPASGLLRAEIFTTCTRTSNSAVADDFG